MSRLNALAFVVLLAAPARAIQVETLFMPIGTQSGGGAPVLEQVEVNSRNAFVRYTTAPASWFLTQLLPGESVAQGLTRLRNLPGIAEAQPNHVYRVNRLPNDPLSGGQYALTQMRMADAWNYEVGASSTVTIAVADSGILSTHPDLDAKFVNLAAGRFFNPNAGGAASVDNPPTTACNHGTEVAGVAAAESDNSTQVAGISWGARLLSLRLFDTPDCNATCSNQGCGTTDASIGNAIAYAATLQNTAAHGKIVVNLSIGGCSSCSPPLQSSITAAVAAGVVIVAAAGNGDCSTGNPFRVQSPGSCDGIIPVGATDPGGAVAPFSSRGPELAANGVIAPGVSVLTTTLANGTASPDGTSFAAPNVSGVAALILAARPAFLPAQVQSTLRSSADPVGLGASAVFKTTSGNSFGAGRVNAFLALQLAVTGRLADFQGEEKVVAFPNPFRADRNDAITFALPASLQSATDVTIRVYTLDGTLVRDLNSVTWNAKNDHGRPVATGTYIFVVSSSSGKKTGRVSVIR